MIKQQEQKLLALIKQYIQQTTIQNTIKQKRIQQRVIFEYDVQRISEILNEIMELRSKNQCKQLLQQQFKQFKIVWKAENNYNSIFNANIRQNFLNQIPQQKIKQEYMKHVMDRHYNILKMLHQSNNPRFPKYWNLIKNQQKNQIQIVMQLGLIIPITCSHLFSQYKEVIINNLSTKIKQKFIIELAECISSLNQLKIQHNDIKTGNIIYSLLDNRFKFIDYDFARIRTYENKENNFTFYQIFNLNQIQKFHQSQNLKENNEQSRQMNFSELYFKTNQQGCLTFQKQQIYQLSTNSQKFYKIMQDNCGKIDALMFENLLIQIFNHQQKVNSYSHSLDETNINITKYAINCSHFLDFLQNASFQQEIIFNKKLNFLFDLIVPSMFARQNCAQFLKKVYYIEKRIRQQNIDNIYQNQTTILQQIFSQSILMAMQLGNSGELIISNSFENFIQQKSSKIQEITLNFLNNNQIKQQKNNYKSQKKLNNAIEKKSQQSFKQQERQKFNLEKMKNNFIIFTQFTLNSSQNSFQVSQNQFQQKKSLNLGKYSQNQNINIQETLDLIQNENEQQKKSQIAFKKKKFDSLKNIQIRKKQLQLQAKMFGQQHQQYIKTLNLLGEQYIYQSDLKKALNCFQAIIKIYQHYKKQKDQWYFRTQSDIGVIYFYHYKFDQALNYHLTNLNQWVFQTHHQLYSAFLHNISMVYMKQKKFDLAQQYFLKTLANNEKLDKVNPSNFVRTYMHFIHIYCQINQLEKAQNILQKSVKFVQLIQQENHPTLAKYYLKKARLRCEQERQVQGFQIMEKGLSIFHQLYKKEHIDTIQGYFQIGYIHLKLNRTEQAENYFSQCLKQTKIIKEQEHLAYEYMLKEINQAKIKVK